MSSHPIRRSAIHHHLNKGVPKTICSERMSVSEEVLSKHYDKRSKEESRTARRDHLDGIYRGVGVFPYINYKYSLLLAYKFMRKNYIWCRTKVR